MCICYLETELSDHSFNRVIFKVNIHVLHSGTEVGKLAFGAVIYMKWRLINAILLCYVTLCYVILCYQYQLMYTGWLLARYAFTNSIVFIVRIKIMGMQSNISIMYIRITTYRCWLQGEYLIALTWPNCQLFLLT